MWPGAASWRHGVSLFLAQIRAPLASLLQNRAYQNFLNNLNKIYSVNQDLNIQYWLTGNA